MGRPANYRIVRETQEQVVIEDIGPWTVHSTVTNDADAVVRKLLPTLNGRRLLYFDSEGELGELKVCEGEFAGFGPA